MSLDPEFAEYLKADPLQNARAMFGDERIKNIALEEAIKLHKEIREYLSHEAEDLWKSNPKTAHEVFGDLRYLFIVTDATILAAHLQFQLLKKRGYLVCLVKKVLS